jgi:hypothetical protein
MSAIHSDDGSDQAGRSLFYELSQSPDLTVRRGAESQLTITRVAERAPFHGVGIYLGCLPWSWHRATRSAMFASPTHITVSAAPQ